MPSAIPLRATAASRYDCYCCAAPLIGYLEWWTSRPAVIGKSSGRGGRTGGGHGQGRGRSSSGRGISLQENTTQAENEQSLVSNAASSISLFSHGFTEDQLKALQRLLNTQVSDAKEKFNGGVGKQGGAPTTICDDGAIGINEGKVDIGEAEAPATDLDQSGVALPEDDVQSAVPPATDLETNPAALDSSHAAPPQVTQVLRRGHCVM
ncbi:hypothetical protein Dimus_010140 [Dionaea muscipula]